MILFDFDGVLIDSVDETLVTAYSAITGKLHYRLEELPSSYVTLFRKFRYIIQLAPDLLVLGEWCMKNPDGALTDAEYQNLKKLALPTYHERRERFFGTRKLIMEKERNCWLTLNKPYEPLWSTLKKTPKSEIFILTNKNREATIELAEHFELPLDPQNIYSGDHGVSKIKNLESIVGRFGPREFSFIEDSVHNLVEVQNDGRFNIRPYLATWGYVGPSDLALAAQRKITPLTQPAAVEILLRGKELSR